MHCCGRDKIAESRPESASYLLKVGGEALELVHGPGHEELLVRAADTLAQKAMRKDVSPWKKPRYVFKKISRDATIQLVPQATRCSSLRDLDEAAHPFVEHLLRRPGPAKVLTGNEP